MQVDMINPVPVSRNTNRMSSTEDNINADVAAADESFPRQQRRSQCMTS
jgi:hypothetical protein